MWGVAIASLVSWAALFPVYLSGSPRAALGWFLVPAVLSNFYLATTLALTQGLVGLRMRGVAAALMLFILNIIGLGMGPQVTGILSDVYAAAFGDDSMRYSLLTVGAVVGPWSAFHYYMAGRSIDHDLERTDDHALPPVGYRNIIIMAFAVLLALALVVYRYTGD